MAAVTLSKYKVYCLTEVQYVLTAGYQENPPTTCPNNASHTIDPNLTEVVNFYIQGGTYIDIDRSGTGGHALTKGHNIEIPQVAPGTNQEFMLESMPIYLRILNISINAAEENLLDKVSLFTAPNTTIGVLTSAANIGDTVFSVSGTAIANIKLGYYLTITDGVNKQNYGMVINKDGPNYQVTVTDESVYNFAVGSLVKISIPRLIDVGLRSQHPITFGDKNPGSAEMPANTQVKLVYTNTDGRAKTLNVIIESMF